ncbi:hypothetical protein SAMN05421504_107310 [Amycolatopsis xylanica]|uniref:Transcriptional regulator, AbiEi antitoxin, Type IV TA system n=1 Tax=Amycolatopsis xylanica TaxID=589385 RepID=A0A1H3NHX2_9PSEU|nr:hypothetical protein SAMN05421504_107310 [Amycolatopsis xylanica]
MVSTAWLRELGVPGRTITRRCEPGGTWQKLLPRAILLSRAVPTEDQRIAAALIYAGENAIVTGLSALRRYGLRQAPAPNRVHLLAPRGAVTSRDFVVIEATTRLPRSRIRMDVPVAPIPRALIDAARRLSNPRAVQAMMAEAIQRRDCTVAALAQELADGPKVGSSLARKALIPLLDGVHSVAEADAWELWQRSGLPACQWNVKIFDEHGNFIAKPDAWCRKVGFAWEIDSRDHHSEDDDFANTVARNARYAAAGIVVLQTLPAWIRSEPDKVIAQLRAAYEAAERRPCPNTRTQGS